MMSNFTVQAVREVNGVLLYALLLIVKNMSKTEGSFDQYFHSTFPQDSSIFPHNI